jgi:hypothetical protein
VEEEFLEDAEFELAFGVQCEHVLREVLGASSFASTVHYFIEHRVSLADSARRPAEFDDALSVLFNPVGAVLLEGRILKRFYQSIEMRFEWNDGKVFREEVEEASRQFSKHVLRPATPSQK